MSLPVAAIWTQRTLEWVFLVPTICGSIYVVLCLLAVVRFETRRRKAPGRASSFRPGVTILKPVHGLEKNQFENLRTACLQDYPEFQVVFSVQRLDDPAIPILRRIQKEFGPERVTLAIEHCKAGTNGKINNMIGGLKHARYDYLVISDSDVRLQPDYLKTIIEPLGDPKVGCACTLYKVACADTWFEKLELLSLNADLMVNIVFAHVTGASKFCLGASMALHRSTLDEIGGLESLADYLVEDFEIGRRIWSSGRKIAVVPYFVETIVDLKSPSQWWSHQVYWDQNNRAARPVGYFATAIIRSTPFALLYAIARLGDAVGLIVLAAAVALWLGTAAIVLGWGFKDREGVRSLGYLFPRDLTSLISWLLSFIKRTTVWRGTEFLVTRDGRLVSKETGP